MGQDILNILEFYGRQPCYHPLVVLAGDIIKLLLRHHLPWHGKLVHHLHQLMVLSAAESLTDQHTVYLPASPDGFHYRVHPENEFLFAVYHRSS